MPHNDIGYEQLTKTLIESFHTLADEVQLLNDRKTILEHKLRFAHEQYQQLADKYAPENSHALSTISKLHLPPDVHLMSDHSGFVPLPRRRITSSKQQTAEAIRDGRRASQQLTCLKSYCTESTESVKSTTVSSSTRLSAQRTSLSTVLEQDFTIPGKKGSLSCPFLPMAGITDRRNDASQSNVGSYRPSVSSPLQEQAMHDPEDPICAALYSETRKSPIPSVTASATKCPIRFLNHHSPEEVAQYFESHKHEIPRSHEVCVKRYQRNEDDIRKLDAKYGNLVSMIQGLGHKHQSMLPADKLGEVKGEEPISNDRVEDWAYGICTSAEEPFDEDSVQDDGDRSSRFDQLKEIRVGESPSRPWGISVPLSELPVEQRTASPPPAPVSTSKQTNQPVTPTKKCPLGRTASKQANPPDEKHEPTTCPRTTPKSNIHCPYSSRREPMPEKLRDTSCRDRISEQAQFIPYPQKLRTTKSEVPQMIFTGPVFIGYPFEQAMAFMKQQQQQQQG